MMDASIVTHEEAVEEAWPALPYKTWRDRLDTFQRMGSCGARTPGYSRGVDRKGTVTGDGYDLILLFQAAAPSPPLSSACQPITK